MTVDDDPEVLRAVERDLRRQYGSRYRVLAADSGPAALNAVEQLKLRNDPIALFLVDQRMPHMSGVEFLEKALPLYPTAKRALLTAYADTDAAIKAINAVKIDHYLMKPWDPPEERLYNVVDDLLDDWQAGYTPVFEGVRVVSHRWSPAGLEIRDFLGRNFIPYQWLNIETDDAAKQLVATSKIDIACLPLVVFADGSFMPKPTVERCRHKIESQDQGGSAVLRFGCGGRGAGGAGGGGLWGGGWFANLAGGTRSARRPGRQKLAHRELPWISRRAERGRPGPEGDCASAPVGGGNSDSAGSCPR